MGAVEEGVQVMAGEDTVHCIVTAPETPKSAPEDVRIRFSVMDAPGATLRVGASAFSAKSPTFVVTDRGELEDDK